MHFSGCERSADRLSEESRSAPDHHNADFWIAMPEFYRNISPSIVVSGDIRFGQRVNRELATSQSFIRMVVVSVMQ